MMYVPLGANPERPWAWPWHHWWPPMLSTSSYRPKPSLNTKIQVSFYREKARIQREGEKERWNLWRWAFGHEWGHWWGVGEGIWGEWWWSQVREWAELICRWIWLRSLCPCSRLCLFHSDRLHRPPPSLFLVCSQVSGDRLSASVCVSGSIVSESLGAAPVFHFFLPLVLWKFFSLKYFF